MAKFITVIGEIVAIPDWTLEKTLVEIKAKKVFNQEVECVACMFGSNTVGAGWQCKAKSGKVLGYMSLADGRFCYADDYEYAICIFIPLSEKPAQIHQAQISYANGQISITL